MNMIPVSESHIRNFTQEGFMIIPEFLDSTELGILRRVCDFSITTLEQEMRAKGVTEDRINVLGKKYFIKDVRKNFPEIKSIIFSEKSAEVCKATIGETAYLHNEQFVIKMADTTSNFAWHQDSGYSVYQGGAAEHSPYLTCWIALDDMSEANGTISVIPFSRSPSKNLIEHHWDSTLNAMVGYYGDDEGDLIHVKAGTLVAFSSFLLHKSGANFTDRPRRSYFMAFTPELFSYSDEPGRIYSSGEPLHKPQQSL